MKPLSIRIAVAAASLLTAASSQASGPAFTGLFARAYDASTVFANPAGMLGGAMIRSVHGLRTSTNQIAGEFV